VKTWLNDDKEDMETCTAEQVEKENQGGGQLTEVNPKMNIKTLYASPMPSVL